MSGMVLVYDAAYVLAALVTSPLWGYRMLRTGKWRTDWPARFGRCHVPARAREGRPRVLIHAVSVGEVNSIRLLVDQLAERDVDVVVSTTTDTGTERARQLYEPGHPVVRFPFDLHRGVSRFLDAVRPDLVALVENEVWPNFMDVATRRRIPVCVINGRLTERSYRRYRWIGRIARRMYGQLAGAAVQTEDYARRFTGVGVGADAVQAVDTMKWDTATVADHVDGADALATELGVDRARPLIVAGSTGPGEERMLIDTRPPEAQLLLVPRKPERFEQVAALEPSIVRRTAGRGATGPPPGRPDLFLLDTMGELRKAYALADVVIVGRSFRGEGFGGLGGSDMIEPCALGRPVIVGPEVSNFADVVAALRAGGAIEVTNDPGPAAAALLADGRRAAELGRRAREVVVARQGATRRYAEILMETLGKNL